MTQDPAGGQVAPARLPAGDLEEPGADRIATHDRRVRVFVSSTLVELAEERRAAHTAISALRLTPVMFELGARPHPPRELYRSYLAQSDVFVGIYGERYGWVAPGSEISGLEDEYRLSGDRPKLLYVKTPAPGREPRLSAMIEQIWADAGASTSPYLDAADLAERIADDLAVLLTERFAANSPDPGGAPLHPAPLPVPSTALLGRDDDLHRVLALLGRPDVRIVTLLGPGGIGKTRLAQEVGLAVQREGARPVCFADLAPLSHPVLVAEAVAAAFGVRPEGTRPVLDVLADRVGNDPVLLVLDNFEHVLAAAPDVAGLLAACPGLQVLVTSRSVLHLRAEHEVVLAPLALPAEGTADVAAVTASPAVGVFVDRAQQVRPDFAVDAGNAADVARIVRRLEGIPLAIELAAARVRLLSPDLLVERLERRLDLSSKDVDRPSRQQTLRTTVEWSYGLLEPGERTLLDRLSVFVDGWSLPAAEAVGAVDGDLDVLETLSALMEHSLVAADGDRRGDPRFRMLQTVREYALERLHAGGGHDAAMRRLGEHLCGLSTRVGEALTGDEVRRWSGRVDADLDTVRAALQWALAQDDAGLVVRLTAPLGRYSFTRGLLGQMFDVAEATAALPSSAALSPRESALLLWSRGTIRIALGRAVEALPLLQDLVGRARALGDDRLLAQALFSLALATPPDPDGGEQARSGAGGQVRAMLEESVALFRSVGDDWGVAMALTPLGDLALLAGDVPTATRMHEEALDRAVRIDDDHMRAQALDQLGLDALMAGDVAAARSRHARAAALHRALRDSEGLAYCLDGLAGVALGSGRPELAARLLGTAERSRAVVGVVVWPFLQPLRDQLVTAVRASLPGGGFEAEQRRGAALDPLTGLDAALDELSGGPGEAVG